jgi:hypothetical protein
LATSSASASGPLVTWIPSVSSWSSMPHPHKRLALCKPEATIIDLAEDRGKRSKRAGYEQRCDGRSAGRDLKQRTSHYFSTTYLRGKRRSLNETRWEILASRGTARLIIQIAKHVVGRCAPSTTKECIHVKQHIVGRLRRSRIDDRWITRDMQPSA